MYRAVIICSQMTSFNSDVKPENLVYVSRDPESDVKLIDFGLAIKTTSFCIEQGVRLGKRPAGTASYMSPETIRNCEYSAKSDVWSAGVTLYALLSGTAPFDQDNRLKQRQQILAGQYIPLDSPQWSHVTDDAKDLVKKMLTVDPTERIGLDDVLLHPWIKNAKNVASVYFGERYLNDMRSLSARSNFKKVVNATVLTIRLRRFALTSILSTSGSTGSLSQISPRKSFSAPAGTSIEQAIMDTEKKPSENPSDMDMKRAPSQSDGSMLPGFTIDQIKELKERFAQAAVETAARSKKPTPALDSRDLAVDYDAFASVMYAVGLEAFATPHVFHIFDTDGNGSVDYREFITTLATFRGNDQETWRLYFDMFDIDGSGEISFDELKLVMAAVLHEDDHQDYSEHDRSSPAGEPSDTNATATVASPGRNERSVSAADMLSSDAHIPLSDAGSVFEFVPDTQNDVVMLTRKKSHEHSDSMHSVSSTGAMSPARMLEPSVSGRVSRVASFQSVFRFAAKADDPRTIEDLFRDMDTNKDGKISFEEFKGWMERDMAKLKNVVQDAIN